MAKTPDFTEGVSSGNPANSTIGNITKGIQSFGSAVNEGLNKIQTLSGNRGTVNETKPSVTVNAPSATTQSTTTATKSLDTPYDALNSNEGWFPNVMTSIRQPTYKARLYMTEDAPIRMEAYSDYAHLLSYLRSLKSTTVLETGVTGLNIASIKINTVAVPTVNLRSMTSTKIDMTVHEPMGVNFLGMLAETAKELKIRNYINNYFFLELAFQGYDEVGNYALNPCASLPNKGVWIYQVKIINIETDFNVTGTTYQLSLLPFNEVIIDSQDKTLPFSLMPEASTVGEMLNKLADELTKSYSELYLRPNTTIPYKEYEFRFQQFKHNNQVIDPSTFKIISSNETQYNTQRNWSLESTGDLVKGHFAHGMKINDIVEAVMANSEAAQRLGKAVMIQGSLDTNKVNMPSSIVFRVLPSTEITGYDYLTQKYTVKYVLTISPFETQEPIVAQQQIDVANDAAAQARNAKRLRESGYLSKRYDYLFTGLNTEITNLDIKYNIAWQASLPRVAGFGGSLESLTDHAMSNPNKFRAEEQAYRDGLMTLKSIQALQTELNRVTKIANGTGTDEEKINAETRRKEIEGKLANYKDKTVEEQQAEVDRLKLALGNSADAYNTQTQNKLGVIPANRAQVRYSEEIISDEKNNTDMLPMPISIVQINSDTRFINSGAFPEYYHRDRSLYGAVLEQMMSTNGGSLQDLVMEIIGDPYWLGSGNFERDFNNMNNTRVTKPIIRDPLVPVDLTRTNYDDGDCMFLLRFKFPSGYDETTNNPILKDNETFTGVYKIKSITHSFENGLFRQTINAFRMPLIQVFKAFGWRDDSGGIK